MTVDAIVTIKYISLRSIKGLNYQLTVIGVVADLHHIVLGEPESHSFH